MRQPTGLLCGGTDILYRFFPARELIILPISSYRRRDILSDVAAVTISASVVYFATWDNCILAWDLAEQAVLCDTTAVASSTNLVRSLVLLKSSKVDQPSVLLAGLGDGSVLVSIVDERGRAMEGSKARKLTLGSTAVELILAENGTVLATCDKPAVLQLEDRGRVGNKYLSVKVRNFIRLQWTHCQHLVN